MPDSIANSTATTSTLTANGNVSSLIDTSGDQDWFRITLTAGSTYTFRQDKSSGSSLDSYLRVFNASGTQVASDDDSGGNSNSLITYTPSSSGVYYIAAGGYSNSTGAYSLSATGTVSTPSDTTAPTLSSRNPADESTNVAANSNIVLTFNETVRAGSGDITISNLTTGGSRTIAVTDTSQVSFSDGVMTINPTTDLNTGNRFEVTFGAGVVKDIAGNSFTGLASGALNFNTEFNSSDIFRSEGRVGGDNSDFGIYNTGKIRVMADFAKAAYSLQPWEENNSNGVMINDKDLKADIAYTEILQQGWMPLNLTITELPPTTTLTSASTPSAADLTVNNSMTGGYYTYANAAAYVAYCKDSLVISFRGTNDNKDGEDDEFHPDKDQWGAPDGSNGKMSDHYALLAPLVAAFDRYASDTANGITHIYVTGHSLGGAMALKYMSEHHGDKYSAITFAAPAFTISGNGNAFDFTPGDSRVLQIEIAQDPVPMTFEAGSDTPRLGKRILFVGNQTMDAPDNFHLYSGNTKYHSMDYYRQITKSIDHSAWQTILTEPGNQDVLIGARQVGENFIIDGQNSNFNYTPTSGYADLITDGYNSNLSYPSNSQSVIYYGGLGNDSLTGATRSDLLLGGSGDDIIYGNDSADRLFGGAGNDLLDGGSGNDVLDGGDGNNSLTGGRGSDTLVGGSGADIFKFRSPSDGIDTIQEFQHGSDKLEFAVAGFSRTFDFFSGTNPVAVNHIPTFLYNTGTGVLSYDSNGSIWFGIDELVTFTGSPTFDIGDFFVV